MSDNLSREATELVREGRQALRPSDTDKARILAAIQDRLVAGNVVPTDTAQTPTAEIPAGGLAVGKLAVLTAGVLAAVAAFIMLNRGQPATRPSEPAATPSAPVASGEPTPNDAIGPTAQSIPPPRATPSAPLRQEIRINDSDRLAEEVALLTRAEKEFHAGNFKPALAVTDEHRQKFPRGALAQERNSLRLQLLCGMGRNDEAQSEAKRLGRLAAGVAASDQVCGDGH